MTIARKRILLGSASPRRLDLLSLLIDRDQIDVMPPEAEELPLDLPMTSAEIDAGLIANVNRKRQALAHFDHRGIALFADTVVVVPISESSFQCLGKPPTQNWQETVTTWFQDYYVRGPHWVRTCFTLIDSYGEAITDVVSTEIEFRQDALELLPWYLSTEESIGKAGGYGLQGAGSLFSTKVTGSLSNVIGLPLEQVLGGLQQIDYFAT